MPLCRELKGLEERAKEPATETCAPVCIIIHHSSVQSWQEELGHWRDRYLGLIEELARNHKDNVEAFVRDRQR